MIPYESFNKTTESQNYFKYIIIHSNPIIQESTTTLFSSFEFELDFDLVQ